MAQNMNVSVTLRLQDQFTGPVKNLLQQLQGLTRAAQQFNQAFSGAGNANGFGRVQAQVRALGNDVKQLASNFSALGRSMSAPSGGGLVQGQVVGMKQLLHLQSQALRNQTQLAGGSGRVPNVGGSGFWGRRGFSPNASLADRAQYRAVNLGEQSLIQGALGLDIARTQLGMLSLSEEDQREAETFARNYSQTFRALNRAHILESIREIIPQFRTTAEAFQFTPELLRIQDWLVLNGSTVEQARSGMLRLTRAVGLTGRLTGPEGNLTLQEASSFIEAYLRGAIIGGADVTPDQAFQVAKYLKTMGQTISMDELLRMFIAMPDLGASTFGNQMFMFVRNLTGRATKEAMAHQARWGLITGGIQESTAGGPRKFVHQSTVDEELLRSAPTEWIARHIIGPTGVLRRMGFDPMTANPGQMAAALRPLFSHGSAENMGNLVVNQIQEWRNQYNRAMALDTSEEQRQRLSGGSTWYQLQAARSGLQDVMGSVAESFKGLLPHLETVRDTLGKIAGFIDPKIGNPLAGLSVLGAGGIAGVIMAMRTFRAMNPMTRTIIGGVGGGLLGGDPVSALMGAMMLRGLGGSAAAINAAAGTAGAAAGQSWARRFVVGAFRFIWLSVGLYLLGQVVENWETVSARIKAIWEDLRQAAPRWIGGEGRGWGAVTGGQGFAQLGKDIRDTLTAYGITGPEHGFPQIDTPLNREFGPDERPWYQRPPPFPAPWELAENAWRWMWGTESPAAAAPAAQAAPSTVTVTGNNIVTHVHVTQSNASPQAIGEAAGNAVQSGLRGALSDLPPMP
jgi:hypothetical protein